MSNIDNSKKAIIAGIVVLAVFAFALSPVLNTQNALAHDDHHGHHHHHHHHHHHD